jgi:chloramphenicol 3-O-phosphotransferase
MSENPRIIVLSGLPGAGKSTLSRRLAQSLDRGAHVEADRLQDLIVSGAVHGTVTGISDEAARQIRLRLHHAALLARSFREAGFNAIIDDIITGHRFDELQAELAGVPFSFIMLVRNLEAMKASWRAMGSPFVNSFDWIDKEIRESTPRVGLWIDTTYQTEDETFEEIVRRLDEAQV